MPSAAAREGTRALLKDSGVGLAGTPGSPGALKAAVVRLLDDGT